MVVQDDEATLAPRGEEGTAAKMAAAIEAGAAEEAAGGVLEVEAAMA